MAKKKIVKDEGKKLRKIQSWIVLSEKFIDQCFKPNYEANWDRYENDRGQSSSRFTDLVNKDILWINQFYPNVELMKSSIRFSNPRLTVKATKKDIETA